MDAPLRIDPTMAVSELHRRYPALGPLFAKYRLDLCCGGAHSLQVVAKKHGLDLGRLLLELEDAIRIPR
jgi:iron-sulfur cluster repair protein YtfE (RIC family)